MLGRKCRLLDYSLPDQNSIVLRGQLTSSHGTLKAAICAAVAKANFVPHTAPKPIAINHIKHSPSSIQNTLGELAIPSGGPRGQSPIPPNVRFNPRIARNST